GTAWSYGCDTVVTGANPCPAVISTRSNKDGSSDKVTLTRYLNAVAGAYITVKFDTLGTVVPATTNFDRLDVDTSLLAASDSRDLRVMLNAGGSVRVCDPNAATTDPRSC
ncbi:MAG: hypothetical protein WBP13_03215, partial [Methylophilaceae bacterium]